MSKAALGACCAVLNIKNWLLQCSQNASSLRGRRSKGKDKGEFEREGRGESAKRDRRRGKGKLPFPPPRSRFALSPRTSRFELELPLSFPFERRPRRLKRISSLIFKIYSDIFLKNMFNILAGDHGEDGIDV